ncbi:MAG: hypothetical protein K9G46_05810 [Flavobacteriales bacterium]|jgi:uncharacterized protein YqgV (UPF0045/DUF77 family)|nr:hypothetical protein [Flavobacteriales bacterium]
MKVTLEITMYPLTDGFKEAVKDFLRRLNKFENIEVITNGVSTQVFGEYDDVMSAYTQALKPSMESGTPIAAVSKIINSHLPPDRWDLSQWT